MKLNKNETEFILTAIRLSDGVLDYSLNDDDFKTYYGMTKLEAEEMLKKLKHKIQGEFVNGLPK